jgi:hypothetical protein
MKDKRQKKECYLANPLIIYQRVTHLIKLLVLLELVEIHSKNREYVEGAEQQPEIYQLFI